MIPIKKITTDNSQSAYYVAGNTAVILFIKAIAA